MNHSPPTRTADDSRVRLAALIRELAPEANAARPAEPAPERQDTRAGRLVERWLPGGNRGVDSLRSLAGRHRIGVVVVAIALLAAIVAAVLLAARQPAAEAAPPLPAAVGAAPPALMATATPTRLVISVVGKVTRPGLVTLTNGARVADAIQAAGGLLPGTDDTALNLARRLTDGEQIYVGVPTPQAAADPPQPADQNPSTDEPTAAGKKGRKSTPDTKINLNTATADQLQDLPGIGPTMAQRILAWRTQHGHFDSIGQLREVGGIGDAKFAKLDKLVTT